MDLERRSSGRPAAARHDQFADRRTAGGSQTSADGEGRQGITGSGSPSRISWQIAGSAGGERRRFARIERGGLLRMSEGIRERLRRRYAEAARSVTDGDRYWALSASW